MQFCFTQLLGTLVSSCDALIEFLFNMASSSSSVPFGRSHEVPERRRVDPSRSSRAQDHFGEPDPASETVFVRR